MHSSLSCGPTGTKDQLKTNGLHWFYHYKFVHFIWSVVDNNHQNSCCCSCNPQCFVGSRFKLMKHLCWSKSLNSTKFQQESHSANTVLFTSIFKDQSTPNSRSETPMVSHCCFEFVLPKCAFSDKVKNAQILWYITTSSHPIASNTDALSDFLTGTSFDTLWRQVTFLI